MKKIAAVGLLLAAAAALAQEDAVVITATRVPQPSLEVPASVDRIYADVRKDNSRKLAEVIQSSLYHSLRKVNPGLENRGVKAAPFIVLSTTEMPAILAEVSCLSNDAEADLLSKPLYRQYIAEALAAGIRSYADAATEGQPGKPGEKGT